MASRSLFVDFWLSGDAPEKERKLGKCISLAKEGMGVLERDGDKVGIAQARKNILLYLSESVPLTKRYNDFRQQLQSIIDIGESVAKDWDQTQDSEDALESLWRSVVCSAMYFDYCFSRSEIEEVATNRREAIDTREVDTAMPATPHTLINTRLRTMSSARFMAAAYSRTSLRRMEERNRMNSMPHT